MRLVPLEDEQPINDRFIYKPSIDTTYLTSKAADEGSNLYDAAKFIGNDMLNTFNSAVDAYKTGIKEIPEYIKAYYRGSARLGSSLGTMVEYLGNQYTMIDEAGLKLQGYSQDDIKNASSIGKYISSFGKVINEFYDDAQEIDILKPSDKFNEPLLDNFTIGKVINKSIESLPFMGAGIATNMVTKSPLIATYAMSALDASELYEKAKEAGKDEATSSIIFQAGVLGTFAFEQFSVFGMLGKEAKDTFLNTFLKGSVREASTESLQTLWQNIVEKIGVDKTKSLVENIIESGIVGGLTGGGLAAATAKYNNNIKEIEQELKDKGTPQEEIEFVYSAVGDGLKSSGSILNDALEGNFNKNVNIMTNFNYVTQLFQEGGDVSKTIIDNSNIDMAKDTVEDIVVKANDTITNNKEIVLENLIKKGYTQEQANEAILSIENLIAKPKQVIEVESKIKDILLEAKVDPKEADSISKIFGSASVYFSNKYDITPQEWVETLGLKVIKSDSTSEADITTSEEYFQSSLTPQQKEFFKDTKVVNENLRSIKQSLIIPVSKEVISKSIATPSKGTAGRGYTEQGDSVNAEIARSNGLATAKEISKAFKKQGIDISADAIESSQSPQEWHHIGKDMKETNFFDVEEFDINSLQKEIILEAKQRQRQLSFNDKVKEQGWDKLSGEDLYKEYQKITGEKYGSYEDTLKMFNGNKNKSRDYLYSFMLQKVAPTSDPNIYKQGVRGNIEFTDTGYIINLFNQANKSTLAHESWHLFSEELRRAAEVSPKAKSDYKALSKWSGLDKAKTPEEVRESLEKMARGGEEYLMLGKSPNARLRQVFENFKGWLTEIYQSIKNLGAGLNKDVINVFDDILGRDYTTKDFATKAEYTKNIDNQLKKKDIIKKTLKGISNFTENLGDIAADSFVPIEDRVKAISPDLFAKVRRLNYSMLQRKKEYYKIAEPFIEKFSKLSDKDHYTLDLALKNSDIETAEEIIKRNGMMQDYLAVRDLMEDLRQQMIEVGADIGQIPNYFPRAIKDVIEFLEYIEAKKTKSKQDAEEFSQIERVLKEKDPNNSLTNEEKAMVINSMLRGYGGQIAISRPSNVKGRKIITVDAEMNQFYKSGSDALIDYITNATEFIENKKFFGGINIETKDLVKKIKNKRERVIEYKDRAAPDVKGRELRRLNYEIGGLEAQIRNAKEADKIKELDERKTKLEEIYSKYADMHAAHVKNSVLKRLNNELTELQSGLDKEGLKNVEQSIGESVRILVENGTIKQKDEAKLRKLFLAKFQEKSMNPAFKLLRDTSYITKLGHFDSAVTQLGDLALSSYKNGLWTTGNEFIKSVRGKSEITKQDLGIDNIIQEFAETGALSKTLDKVLKFTGFSKIDSFGKETLVNGAISNARKKARLNDPKLIKDLELYYGEQSQKVLSDLANNKLTPEVMEYGFFTLLDIQPITKDQMPLYYAEGGNKRLFYMLKSYTLKTINLARNDIILKFSDSPKEAIRNLILLGSYLMLFNAGVDFLKDLLLGREIKSVPDYLVDNMFFGGIFNRYTLRKTKQEGVGGALWDMMSPPILIDEITVDLLKKNKEIKDYRSWQNLPLIGRFYYNYWGGGKESKKLY
jgi:hypothetical protein